MKYEIDNPAQFGIVKDLPPHEMPTNAWSDGKNVRFDDATAMRIDGETNHFTPTISASDASSIRYLDPIRGDSDYYWVYATDKALWSLNTGGTKSNLIAQGVTSSTQWTSGFLEGQVIYTNTDETTPFHPYSWAPGGAISPLTWNATGTASTSWAGETGAGNSCLTLRAFKQYGVALGMIENTEPFRRRVRWSHPADPGAMPITWDDTKPQYDAGYVDLDDDPEPVIDCAVMRGDNIVYKYNSIHRMSAIGAPYIFGFNRIFNNIGVRARNCVKEFYGRHVVFGFEDIIIHNGQEHQSILDHTMRSYLTNAVDDTNSDLCVVAINHQSNDIYFCYPESGEPDLTEAIVWNWADNTTTIRELPHNTYMATGLISPTGAAATFDDDTTAYSAMTGAFNTQLYTQSRRSIVHAYNDTTKQVVFQDSTSAAFINKDMLTFVERTGLPIPSLDGNIDTKELKFIYRVYIRAESSEALVVKLASQDMLNGTVTWTTYSFNPNTEYKLDCRITTRIPGIYIRPAKGASFKLHGVTMEYNMAGWR